ncbi:MAG: hypothetical protein KAR20_09435, partial [Candidatus Heimdallarchaeota archaeon]|nr:hypothetical protein [Candidatus Heimdallarchaeota archaeon]
IIIGISSVFSQENPEDSKPTKLKESPKLVKASFEDIVLINHQTSDVLRKNTLQMEIQHRFGRIDQGFQEGNNFDLFGIFGSSNIRLGLNFGLSDRLMIGIGGAKNNLYNAQVKYKLFRQTETKGMPVSVTYYGNTAINISENSDFSTFSKRLSYFHQILISRKFNNKLSLLIAPSIAHFNIIDSTRYQDISHDNFSVSLSGRYKFAALASFIFEYTQPLTIAESIGTKPDLGVGIEIATRSHAFQLFVGTASAIINQRNVVYNYQDFTMGEVHLGFNITRRWNF